MATFEIPGQDEPEEVQLAFPVPSLDAAVHQRLGRPAEEPISSSDVGLITHLHARSGGITDLTGIEALTALTGLSLALNQISNIGPLSELVRLWHLDLDDNLVSDLSPLSGLERLEHLNLNGNEIGDVTPLAGEV